MYQLEKLNYLYQDIEPYIDTHTMALHYNKHTKKYLNNLNELLIKNKFNFSISMEDLAKEINKYSFEDQDSILFNLGGVLNHQLYFQCISEKKKDPEGILRKDLIEKYGSIPAFINELIKTAMKLRGSGYTFLEMDENNNLIIKNRKDQDSPLFTKNIPLFTVDLWEHAYYINNENDKEKYLKNFFEVSDFTYANKIYEQQKMTNESSIR